MLNRCAARTVIARETAEALADHDPPVLAARIGQRVVFADAAQSGRLVFELDAARPGRARDRRAGRRNRRVACHDRAQPPKRGFAARPGDRRDAGSAAPEPSTAPRRRPPSFTARLTIDVTPALRGRIKIAAFQRGLTVADMLRALLAREFPERWRPA